MPAPSAPAGAAKAAKRLRCESCLEILSLRHAWDVRGCFCGALLLSGRPHKPVIHWLSRPGGGWSEADADAAVEETDDGEDGDPCVERRGRRLGFIAFR